MRTRRLRKDEILRECCRWSVEELGVNECVTKPNGGGNLRVSSDGAIVLAVFPELHPLELVGIFDLNPELFGLDFDSQAWQKFLRCRDYCDKAWRQDVRPEIRRGLWYETIQEMLNYLPDEIPFFSRRMPLGAESAERNCH